MVADGGTLLNSARHPTSLEPRLTGNTIVVTPTPLKRRITALTAVFVRDAQIVFFGLNRRKIAFIDAFVLGALFQTRSKPF